MGDIVVDLELGLYRYIAIRIVFDFRRTCERRQQPCDHHGAAA